MAGSRGRYPPEYKEQIVELVRSGRSPGSLSWEFEPSEQTIRNWVKQADLDEGRRSGGLTTEAIEKVRRTEQKERPELKRIRWMWLCNPERLSPSQQHRLDELLDPSQIALDTAQVYQLKLSSSAANSLSTYPLETARSRNWWRHISSGDYADGQPYKVVNMKPEGRRCCGG